jgi:hypothetical protein
VTRVTDRPYLDWLRGQPCILTGLRATDDMAVDPVHIGTYGKGMKTDDEALPIRHDLHARGHHAGEVTMLRMHAPDWLLRKAFRALAHEMYAEYRRERGG